MESLPPEIVLRLCEWLTERTAVGFETLTGLALTCKRMHFLITASKRLWRLHWDSCFDAPEPESGNDYKALLSSRWSQLRRSLVAVMFQLVREHRSRNLGHVLPLVDALLRDHFVASFQAPERCRQVLLILLHLAWSDHALREKIGADPSINFCVTRTIRVEQFLQDEELDFSPNWVFASTRETKIMFLQLALILRLPLAKAPKGIPKLLSFGSTMSLAQWDRLHASNPREFWANLVPGEWTGFYADYRLDLLEEAADRRCDGPMYNLKFQWAEETSIALSLADESDRLSPVLRFSGSGEDDYREFTMTGRILSGSRTVYMRKTYLAGRSWELEGVLNEFGIVGSWGEGSGTFFLWKVQT